MAEAKTAAVKVGTVKVEIITDRKPWAAGTAWEKGDMADLPPTEAALLIERSFARKV